MKKVTSAWKLGIVACAVVAGAGCNRTPAEQEAARPAAQTESAEHSDAAITTSVRAKYYADDSVRSRNIDVTTEDGVVTLRGTVDSEAAKDQAVKLAQSVEGVSRVDDQLRVGAETETAAARGEQAPRTQEPSETVGTAGRTAAETVQPAWITTKIQSQYFVNPEITPWNIDVTTQSNGVVTLEGEVDSAEDKAEAVRIARATEGVTRVDDRLRVKGETAEPDEPAAAPGEPEAAVTAADAWLTAKIQAKYFVDDDVKGREIDVDTQNGVVTLTGAVATDAERRQAVALARNTDGVKNVTDRLEVQPDLAEAAATRPGMEKVPPVTPVLDDTWITTKIQSKFFLDASVKGHRINVDTQKGVVTLTGTVDTEQQKNEAEQIARGTDGVSKVINNLAVGRR